jgi:hypothetical protein
MTAAVVAPQRSGHRWIIQVIESWGCLTQNLEDLVLDGFEHRLRSGTAGVEWMNGALYVLVVRGFFNWLASAMLLNVTRKKNVGVAVDRLSRIWYGIAVEARGISRFIRHPKVVVRYELFKRDEASRRLLCDFLGGVYSEERIDLVPTGGGGSSFDGIKYRDRGSEMVTNGRCLQVMGSEHRDRYIELARANETIAQFYVENFEVEPSEEAVSREIFGWR